MPRAGPAGHRGCRVPGLVAVASPERSPRRPGDDRRFSPAATSPPVLRCFPAGDRPRSKYRRVSIPFPSARRRGKFLFRTSETGKSSRALALNQGGQSLVYQFPQFPAARQVPGLCDEVIVERDRSPHKHTSFASNIASYYSFLYDTIRVNVSAQDWDYPKYRYISWRFYGNIANYVYKITAQP